METQLTRLNYATSAQMAITVRNDLISAQPAGRFRRRMHTYSRENHPQPPGPVQAHQLASLSHQTRNLINAVLE
jgi:hypothetical protein